MALLEVHNLNKAFGGIRAVDDCTFSVEEGKIAALIGPNGAGKTTAFNLISGVLKPDSGRVIFNGNEIQTKQPHQITRLGLSRTFQISRNLEEMTVLENLIVQSPVKGIMGILRGAITAEERDKALSLLNFVGIEHLAYTETRSLSYGQKKLMDFAALLMSDPQMLLLDEPAGGVNPALLEKIVQHIYELNQQGKTIFIVEHNMDLVMSIADPVIVMAYGQVIASGPPSIVQEDERVLEAYLGAVAGT